MTNTVAAGPIGRESRFTGLSRRLTAAVTSGRIAGAVASTGALALAVALTTLPPNHSWTAFAVIGWWVVLASACILRGLFDRSGYRGGIWPSLTRDYSFAASGWIISLGIAWWFGTIAWRTLWSATIDWSLQSLIPPATVFASLLIAAGCALAVRRAPAQLARWRFSGLISEVAGRDLVAVMVMSPLLQIVWFIFLVGEGASSEDMNYGIPLTVLAVAVYSVSQLTTVALRKRPDEWVSRDQETRTPFQRRLLGSYFHVTWLVVDWPIKTRADRRLINRIAKDLKAFGPFVCVAHVGSVLISEHLMLANRLGQLAAIFPRTPSDLRDWSKTLPPESTWTGLPLRQLQPADEMMTAAVVGLLGAQDAVLLLARQQTDLMRWTGLLPTDLTVVLWAGDQAITTKSIAGYEVVKLNEASM